MAKNNGSGKGRGGLGRPSMRHKKHAIMIKTAHRKEDIARNANKNKCE
jgi:hypothetical protein